MNKLPSVLSVLPLLLSLPLLAQEMPAPAPELAQLKPLEGHWQGKGTATMMPGAPPSTWTSASTYQWVMGGFWLQCDTAIDFGPMGTMRFREYLGWDGENKQFATLAVNNLGEGVLAHAHLKDGEMVMMIPKVQPDGPATECARVKFTADKMEMAISFLRVDGKATQDVTGTFTKVARLEIPALGASKAMMPAAPQMAAMAKMAGKFDFAGQMIMAPGAPEMKIRGRDTITSLFDGAVVMVETVGESDGGPQYLATGFYVWEHGKDRYRILSVDNMGMVMAGDAWLSGQSMVATFAGPRMGQPTVSRMVLTLGKDGGPEKIVGHSITGEHPPVQDFSGTYTRSK
ncbi:MAG: DUF1579 family protein [Planctomycetes bacterium]|nr:DUF1579 family protein [Planctomycetota bacterium]